MPEFGEVKPVDIRDIWPNEATDFTPWLVENIYRLGQALGMEIEVQQREANVGDFSLDIMAKELGTGRIVVIENQLNGTDHDHLGKLLTYAGGFDAGVLVWIAKEIRDEHRKALEWLNENTNPDIDCFAVVIEVFQIDDSKPAFRFTPVVSPNEWQKSKRSGRTEVSERAEAYREYFQALIDDLREKHKFTNAKAGQPQSWYQFRSGTRGLELCNSFAQGGQVRAELYIDLEDKDRNKQLFDSLLKQKSIIEGEYRAELTWERLDDKRASRIAIYRNGNIKEDSEALSEIRNWSIEHLLNLKKVLLPKAKSILNDMEKNQ